jgi:hypothetical protein
MKLPFASRFARLSIVALLAAIALAWCHDARLLAQDAKPSAYETLLKDAKTHTGLIKLHHKGQKVYAELASGNLNKDYIVLISIARGIGEGPLLGGMSWGFGDDWLWQFRKVDDETVQIVRRNVRFTAKEGSPEHRAVQLAYTDSVLFSLKVEAKSPSGALVVDLTPVFMSDLPQIGQVLRGFAFASSRSTWAAVKAFPDNIELEVAATYASGGGTELVTVADSRGVTINVHYSISALPNTGYKPRYADDRVGYFLTVIKDYSRQGMEDQFVRYINRWDLQKADSQAELSPPKKPIIFWLEKTIPYQYRKPIREGILEWNKAFEAIGITGAIEVRQQPDNADWDPEDINYNTFRWITSGAGFAMGPSRVNPLTGQILDADIIFDADFVQFWKDEYETFTASSIAEMTGGPLDLQSYAESPSHWLAPRHGERCRCDLHHGFSRQLAFGATAIEAQLAAADAAARAAAQEKLIFQGLKEVTMHEVGHTLGLRHNFKASTWRPVDDLHVTSSTGETALSASVMDYLPANIAPSGKPQGAYYSTTIGPYDYWAIEYGYKPLSGGTDGEVAELKKIASRIGEAGLDYATDEDTRGIDPDPLSNRFDLGSDPVQYAQQRVALISELWPGLIDRVTKEGEGYQKARRAFGILLGNHGQAVYLASRFVGGLYVNRDHKGDAGGRAPFVVVEAARQREALRVVNEQIFSDKPFQFPPELYNYLASTRWSHWGMPNRTRTDLAVHEVINLWQERVLSQLLSPLTLARLHDSELKVPAGEDAFTVAELLQSLTDAIFAELKSLEPGEYSARNQAISSLRRNLQRSYLRRLAQIALGTGGAPQDCQTLAYATLKRLGTQIDQVQARQDLQLDPYTLAHLAESSSRIQRVLAAELTLPQP